MFRFREERRSMYSSVLHYITFKNITTKTFFYKSIQSKLTFGSKLNVLISTITDILNLNQDFYLFI